MLSADDAIAQLAARVRGPSLIALDGLPLAGKSTLAERIEAELGYACLSTDDFVDRPFDRSLRRTPGFPFPFFRNDEMRAALRALRGDGTCTYHPFEWDARRVSAEARTLRLDRPILVEGTGVLALELCPLYDLKLFVVSDHATTFAAHSLRDGPEHDDLWSTLFLPSVDHYMTTEPELRADLLIAGRGVD